jgi:Tol biopolymer transport system component
MRSRIVRFSTIVGLVALVGGCEDPPLSPDEERASLSGQSSLAAPSDLTATALSPTQVNLAWRDRSSSETGFEVQRSTTGARGTFAPLTKTGANITSYSNTDLSPSTEYCYKVRAVGGTINKPKYSLFSNTSCAPPPTPSAAPTALKALGVSSTKIDLSWTDNASDETGFNIERCQDTDCTGFIEVGQVATDATTWVSTELSPGTTYSYRVRARKGTAFSEYSATATAVTLPPPQLHVGARTTGVDLDPDGYQIEVVEDGGGWRTSSLPADGTVTFPDVKQGTITVSLRGEAPNCYLTTLSSQVIDYDTSTTVTFDVTCNRGTSIAYADTSNGNAEIYTIETTGNGATTRLTFHPASDVEPAWSTDGARIAFRSDRDGDEEIYVMNADGSNPVRLTSQPGNDGNPAWSPDGSRIAFESNRDTQSKIAVMNADGTGVTATNQDGSAPSWSPDGQRIAFASGPIYLMNADGTGVTRLTNPLNNGIPGAGIEYDTNPTWSPDGTSIVYARSSCWDGCVHQIMRVTADGAGEASLEFTDGYEGTSEGEPVWSPEGRKIAFVGAHSIVVLRADGTDAMPLAVGFSPAWQR